MEDREIVEEREEERLRGVGEVIFSSDVLVTVSCCVASMQVSEVRKWAYFGFVCVCTRAV